MVAMAVLALSGEPANVDVCTTSASRRQLCLTAALLYLYIRRHEHVARFRNTLLLANVIGLIGYVAMPTAPPRLLGLGFIDEHHKDGLVQLAANPYAALQPMPSMRE